MKTLDHLAELARDFREEQKEIFDSSDQAMYFYLDDYCRGCNEKFAQLLGYSSADEWVNTDSKGAFPKVFVDEGSQRTLVSAFQNAMAKRVGSTINVSWKKKSGGTVDTTVILVPVAYKNHVFALHFVS